MTLATALLWIHALSGIVWTGACAAFVLAGSALAVGSEEWRDFALRVAPAMDRVNLGAAAFLLATGALNLAIAAEMRNYSFSPAFWTVLGAKAGLFAAMAWMLGASWRAEAALRSDLASGMNRMLKFSGLTVIAGAAALGLGLWLAGS